MSNKENIQKLKTEFDEVKDLFIAFGDEKRQLIIVSLIHDDSDQGLQVTDLTEVTGLSRPAVSHHLKILKDAGIVDIRKDGTKNYYYLTDCVDKLKSLRLLTDDLIAYRESDKN